MEVSLPCARSLCSLDDRQTKGSKTKDSHRSAGLHFGVVEHSTPASGDATAKEAHFAQICSGVDFGSRYLCYHCILCEGGTAHEVEDFLAILGETSGAIRHHTLALGRPGH